MGTMQVSVSPERLQSYLDECVFRFNRRHSRSHGLLFRHPVREPLVGEPVTDQDPRRVGRASPAPVPRQNAGSQPASVDVGYP